MKYLKYILPVLALTLIVGCGAKTPQANNANSSVDKRGEEVKIEVIDFHSTHRCMTCNAIEANTKYTLETYFGEELKKGEITFAVINVDDEANVAIAEKFEAAGTALFLNCISPKGEQAIDLTEFAFSYGTEKEEFAAKLKDMIEIELEQL